MALSRRVGDPSPRSRDSLQPDRAGGQLDGPPGPHLRLGFVPQQFFQPDAGFFGPQFPGGMGGLLPLVAVDLNRESKPEDPLQKLVRWHLGRFERWPLVLKLLLPFVLAALLWLALHPLLRAWEIVPPTTTLGHVAQQSVLIGLGVYLVWKYVLGAVLAFYLLNSYIYLGQHPVWEFVEQTGAALLRPLRKLPLRLGKVDFAPVVGIALIFLLAEGLERGLILVFKRLPF
jgi:uncharacterized protein YggT (Ycf19 family)